MKIRLAIVAASLAAIVSTAGAQHVGQYDPVDIEYGAQLYGGQCITCHGESGDLMPGVNLRSGRFRNAPTDRDLTNVLRNGIDGTAMTATGYTNSEIVALIAYLRNMNSIDPNGLVVGDPIRGSEIYFGKGDCDSCHRIFGNGPLIAPDLSNVGAERTAALLTRVLIDPTSGMVPVNRPVEITTRDGSVVSGRRLNEDTLTVQIVDAQARLRTFEKSTLRSYRIGSDASMPSYADRLSETERADVVAYLLSLKGMNR